jgi:hypothetical protein
MDFEAPLLKDIDADTGFAHFDMGLTEEEHNALAKIQVNDNATYDNFGDIETSEVNIALFLGKLGNNPVGAKEQAAIIARLIQKTIQGCGSETAWVTIRATLPTDMYNTPRWHMDGYFYSPYSGDQHKVVMALKGDSTLFNSLPQSLRDVFKRLQEDMPNEEKNRKLRAEMLSSSKAMTAPSGCGTVFKARVAIHSEPPFLSDRVFLSILPGSKAQIEELRQRWGVAHKTEIKTNQNNKSFYP